MWLLAPRGFFSIVSDGTDPDRVLVRTRVRSDLEALEDLLPDLGITHDASRDYAFRARVLNADWNRAASALAEEIDYGNFKDTVAGRQGYERARLYGAVWSVLRGLQRD